MPLTSQLLKECVTVLSRLINQLLLKPRVHYCQRNSWCRDPGIMEARGTTPFRVLVKLARKVGNAVEEEKDLAAQRDDIEKILEKGRRRAEYLINPAGKPSDTEEEKDAWQAEEERLMLLLWSVELKRQQDEEAQKLKRQQDEEAQKLKEQQDEEAQVDSMAQQVKYHLQRISKYWSRDRLQRVPGASTRNNCWP